MWVKYVLPAIAGAVLVAGLGWFVKRNLRDLIDVLFDSLDEPEKPEREGDNHE